MHALRSPCVGLGSLRSNTYSTNRVQQHNNNCRNNCCSANEKTMACLCTICSRQIASWTRMTASDLSSTANSRSIDSPRVSPTAHSRVSRLLTWVMMSATDAHALAWLTLLTTKIYFVQPTNDLSIYQEVSKAGESSLRAVISC